MSYSYDVTTPVGQVRLLIPDHNQAAPVFQDEDILAMIGIEGQNIKRSAALCIEAIASDQALTLKVIRIQDLSKDGARTSDALLKRAEKLREQAQFDESREIGGAFDIAEQTPTDFAYRERLWDERLRNSTDG